MTVRWLPRPEATAAAIFLLAMALLAAMIPLLSPHDPVWLDPGRRLEPPSVEHWLGTDDLGRDVLTRALYGARVSFVVGGTVTLLAVAGGSLLGLLSAYDPRLDPLLMRIVDGLLACPSILLAIALMASLGPSAANVVLALGAVYTAPVARLVRSATLVTTQLAYVEAARTLGASDARILRLHVLPNVLSPIVVHGSFTIGVAIVSEATLSFLGASVPPGIPTWGNMLRDGQRLLSRAWWVATGPGTGLFLTVLSFNVLADALRDALDPRGRGPVPGSSRGA